jgi:pyridoxamine 5'-phosphate oxidase
MTDPTRAPDFLNETDPFHLVEKWCAEAEAAEPRDANAIQVATVDEAGLPDIRTVLVRGRSEAGFAFFTNFQSAKGRQLLTSRKAALLYYWKSLSRQIRVRGPVEVVTEAEADDYFATRPRDSQIGAWASDQSRPMASRAVFDARIAEFGERFANSSVPRPPHWSGFRLIPTYIEFWQERPFRLHDRLVFTRAGDSWRREQLYP